MNYPLSKKKSPMDWVRTEYGIWDDEALIHFWFHKKKKKKKKKEKGLQGTLIALTWCVFLSQAAVAKTVTFCFLSLRVEDITSEEKDDDTLPRNKIKKQK